jgi:hypothetical protein
MIPELFLLNTKSLALIGVPLFFKRYIICNRKNLPADTFGPGTNVFFNTVPRRYQNVASLKFE